MGHAGKSNPISPCCGTSQRLLIMIENGLNGGKLFIHSVCVYCM